MKNIAAPLSSFNSPIKLNSKGILLLACLDKSVPIASNTYKINLL